MHGRSHTLSFTYTGNSNQLNLAFTTEPKKAMLAYSSTWPTHWAGLVPFNVRQVPCATLVSVARMQVHMETYCIGSRANHQSQTFLWTVLIIIFLQLQRWKGKIIIIRAGARDWQDYLWMPLLMQSLHRVCMVLLMIVVLQTSGDLIILYGWHFKIGEFFYQHQHS